MISNTSGGKVRAKGDKREVGAKADKGDAGPAAVLVHVELLLARGEQGAQGECGMKGS